MPRKPRKKAISGVYHVMLRGINKQIIFEDDEDRMKMLKTLRYSKEKCGFNLYGYCLMDNHVHLLMRERGKTVSTSIQHIGASYVFWYNQKYERVGHLYQNRFRSETVESEASFLRVLRYIHQNPLKAGLAKDVFSSKWTSFSEYLGHGHLVDADYGLHLFSSQRKTAIQLFSEYMNMTNNDEFLDDSPRPANLTDQDLIAYMVREGVPGGSALQQMDRAERDAIILKMKHMDGVSVRQLARVTGISKSVISRV